MMNAWEVSPLKPMGGSKTVFEREIEGGRYRFDMTDIRARRRMAQKATGHFKHFASTVFAGMAGAELDLFVQDDNEGFRLNLTEENMPRAIELLKGAAPDILDGIADDSLNDFIDELVGHAFFFINGEYKSLANDEVAEAAFGDDLTLFYPVALCVLEVNTKAGFFMKLFRGFVSEKSETEKSEVVSD